MIAPRNEIIGDLYLWMCRDKPRKGEQPGPWKPLPFVGPWHTEEFHRHCVECRIDPELNTFDKKQDHAIFKIPASALRIVYPVAPSPLFEGATG